VRIPGSTSNLGPGFDALGLALDLHTTLTFDLLAQGAPDSALITLHGDTVRALPADASNLVYKILGDQWQDSPELLSRVRITIESDIPLSRGLGSSAAATLGTIWAAWALKEMPLNGDELLRRATAYEGHPDNVAASLFGGLVVCARAGGNGKIVVKKLSWPEEWSTLVVVPPYPLSTHAARSVLPKTVPLADAVANIQNVSLLVSAVATKDESALRTALHDRLHEPYRLHLVPELSSLRAQLRQLPALGCVLSGAGSSVLVVTANRHKEQILEFLEAWRVRTAPEARVLDLRIAKTGIEEFNGTLAGQKG
jgi:homoserine kinase